MFSKKYWILLIIISLSYLLSAKDYQIIFQIEGLPQSEVLLTDFKGNDNSIIDSVQSNADGLVVFTLSDKYQTGMYKIVFLQNQFIDFVFNKEDIHIKTSLPSFKEKIQVIKSKENKVFIDFLRFQAETDNKLDVLNYVNTNYPQSDFLKTAQKEYNTIINEYESYVSKVINENKNLYSSKLITVKKENYPSIDIPSYLQNDYKKSNYFKNVDFSDTSLIYSDVLTQKAINYLSLFSSKHYSEEQQNRFFIQAIDTILAKTQNYPKTYDFIVDYLISGFESMGYIEVVRYISDQYLQLNSCENENNRTTLQRKAYSNKFLIEGEKYPEFSLKTNEGIEFSSKDKSDKYILLMFWATWCPHCREEIPQLKKIFNYKTIPFDIVTISLDTSVTDWSNFVTQMKLTDFVNHCDGKGWDGDIATKFNVYASPTYFLLHNGVIISKPLEIQSLARQLQKEGLIR